MRYLDPVRFGARHLRRKRRRHSEIGAVCIEGYELRKLLPDTFRDLFCQIGVRTVGVLKLDTSRPSDGCISERTHQSVNDVLPLV